MKVSTVMTRGVITIGPQASIREVSKVIFKKKVKAIPVVDAKKRLLGIVTRESLLERFYPDYKKLFSGGDAFPDFEDMEGDVAAKFRGLTAEKIMTPHVIYTREDTPLMRALSRMIVRRVNQLPVLSDRGTLVGMVTKGDIFYSMFKKQLK